MNSLNDPPPDGDVSRAAKPRRRASWLLLAAVILGVAGWVATHLGPSNHEIDAWLDDLNPSAKVPPERRLAAEQAIRRLGPRALPRLVECLRNDPHHRRLKVNAWLNKQSWIKFRFAIPPDRSDAAVEAFKLLGPVGRPALNKLAGLMKNSRTCRNAVNCLGAIGPAAVPVLTNSLASTDGSIRYWSLAGLGEITPAPLELIPLVLGKTRDPDRMVGACAVQALGCMANEGKPVFSLMTPVSGDTNRTRETAFMLSLLGSNGVPFLVCQLTNSDALTRLSALVALDPEFQRVARERLRNRMDPSLGALGHVFTQKVAMAEWRFHTGTGPAFMASVLSANFSQANARARARMAALLGDCGYQAAPATPVLSNALADPDPVVRGNAAAALAKLKLDVREGGIIRGPKDRKRIALEFTGHTFAEGGEVILDELARHQAKASFFLTGDFLANPAFEPLIRRMVREGHYVGPHSDKHLLYCPWDGPKQTLVTRREFTGDLQANIQKLRKFGLERGRVQFWLPAYEWYNQEIAEWSSYLGPTLVDFTPGTRSNADYLEDADKHFISSQAIVDSILAKEHSDPNGLNGFLLLLHLGSGPGRTDKMHALFGRLLDDLAGKGYQFVRIDELLPSPQVTVSLP